MPTNRITPYLPAIDQALARPPVASEFDAGRTIGYEEGQRDGFSEGAVAAMVVVVLVLGAVAWWMR